MIIGIDASRNRSGGARAHIIGILSEIEELPTEIENVHIWSYKELLDLLPNHSWLIKHTSSLLEKSLFHQIWWQYMLLAAEARKNDINIMLNTDAGTVSRFHPSVTISRDMLSYEKGEIERFGLGIAKLRLFALRYIQNHSLRKSEGTIFLTKYASKVIQTYCGKITNYTIIPHGVSKAFSVITNNGLWLDSEKDHIRCLYVSNIAPYKHQWNVVKAIKLLRVKGFNLSIVFVGGGDGRAQALFEKEVKMADPNNEFITQHDFVNHTDIPDFLARSDIFIFASSCENMPNTLVEGMSSGLPIACSDRGPMPEVLKDGGVYFDPENYFSIAKAIEELIKNEKKRVAYSKRARELSQQYSWRKCANETLEYMKEIYKEQFKN